jgi:hypothetical protein
MGATEYNPKGYFEVLQVCDFNNWLLYKQTMTWCLGFETYNHSKGTDYFLNNDPEGFKGFRQECVHKDPPHGSSISRNSGIKATAFYNDPINFPWMMKDPRLCILLKTWLVLLKYTPVVLFTYRHPLDVALSLYHRENVPIERGLWVWYNYNKLAIQNSQDTCRVVTSCHAITTTTRKALGHIRSDFIRKCNFSLPGHISDDTINKFLSVELLHSKHEVQPISCNQFLDNELGSMALPRKWNTTDAAHIHLYVESIRLFCDMESGIAFEESYSWAHLMRYKSRL